MAGSWSAGRGNPGLSVRQGMRANSLFPGLKLGPSWGSPGDPYLGSEQKQCLAGWDRTLGCWTGCSIEAGKFARKVVSAQHEMDFRRASGPSTLGIVFLWEQRAKYGVQSRTRVRTCVLGSFCQGRQEWVNMAVFFLFGVSALFGMSLGQRVPEKLGVGGLRSLKKGSLALC